MLTLVSYLQANDPEQNLHRFYRIEYGQDLFGQWIIPVLSLQEMQGTMFGSWRVRLLLMIVDTAHYQKR